MSRPTSPSSRSSRPGSGRRPAGSSGSERGKPNVEFSQQHNRMMALRRAQESPRPSTIGTSGADEEDTDEDVQLLGNARANKMKLDLMAGRKAPEIHDYPAPPAAPPHSQYIPASLVYQNKAETAISRTLNSSMGRAFTFILTLATFLCAAYGMMDFREPLRKMYGNHYLILGQTVFMVILLYTCIPILSEKAGMMPRTSGWKPYLVVYRFAFILAVPAFVLIYYGWGAMTAFGDAEGVAGQVLVSDLTANSAKYFEAADGFVALNLTKGIWKTASRTEHGGVGQRRISRFRDAELLINTEPYTGLEEPTVPPGALDLYVMAPIFSTWEPCAAKYRISSTCLGKYPPRGWALIKSGGICNDMSMLACRPQQPKLRPFYKCSTENIDGRSMTGPIQGLCGRIVLPPPQPIMDELGALLLAEQWPKQVLPNETVPWIDVSADECIAQPKACLDHWNLLGILGMCLSIVVVLCIAIPAVIDWKVDNRIRDARKFWDDPGKYLGNQSNFT
eukprot:TRINITY_DN26069_c0_g1_i1.p1 TRINITY_DN26069_c0_g1~~TRINITY_DN26069_c0_g1_i1.p1  ORF type:complete len:552 (+),score=70.57 TRINITY_DN26069_c0_g1_i1:140-1657(+)